MAEVKKNEKDAPAAQPETPAKKVPIIKVRSKLKSKPDGGHPVALSERDDAHPGGEAFVAGPKVVEVALTATVKAKLREDVLEEVE